MAIKGSCLLFSLCMGLLFYSLSMGLFFSLSIGLFYSLGMFRRKELTPSASSLDCGSAEDFDVFLNFRGPDSRHTVANVIYHTLNEAGIRVFLDNEEIHKGEVIEGALLRAITNSKIYITIFSKDYASSKWCLRELAKMMECLKSSSGKTKKVILPVFYDVDVTKDVKLRSDMYTCALQEHKKQLGQAVVKPWVDALKDTAKIKGWNLNEYGMMELANLIKVEVAGIIYSGEAILDVPDRLVGLHDQIKAIMQLFDERLPDFRFIVIHGMGGSGKTTLANSVFKKVSSNFHFQGCCKLLDIQESSSVKAKVELQKRLLKDTLKINSEVSDIDVGINMIRTRLCHKKVLIFLDNVESWDHLKNLAAESNWFGPKSKVIITTRNINFLPAIDKNYFLYNMKELGHGHALQLFCRHAFHCDFPPPEYFDISTEIVTTTGGLPLAIEVIGSLLYNKHDGEWESTLKDLMDAPHEDVQRTLMISYKALTYKQREIFLDIACFFNNELKMDPIYFWEACNLRPNDVIQVLKERSLIKVNEHGELWMHDQLRYLGRAIAQPKRQDLEHQIPYEPSRLWSPEVALKLVQKREVGASVVALELGNLDASCGFVREEFVRLINIKFLQLQGGNFNGDFEDVLLKLRWLSWFNCPSRIGAINLSFKNLVVLKLSCSQITIDWDGWGQLMAANQLKVMSLIGCTYLAKTPDFSAFLGLKRLIFIYCFGLEEIEQSITKLIHLDYLEISNGSKNFGGYWHYFRGYPQEMPPRPLLLPHFIGHLKSLTVLKINNAGLTELHSSIGELAKLKYLSLRCPQLKHLPKSVGRLVSLVELDISFSGIKLLPDEIGCLNSLGILRMDDTTISYLPDSIGGLQHLNELQLSRTEINVLPETVRNLEMLKIINLSFTSVEELPKVLGMVKNLEQLHASHCTRMDGELPEEIEKLSSLRILNLCDTKVSRVPASLNQLCHLQELILGEFCEPQKLPKLPMGLTRLEVSFSSLEPHRVSDLSKMTNLVTLKLCDGNSRKPPRMSRPHVQTTEMEWLAKLVKMEKLTLVLSDLTLPPTDLTSLSRLQMLDITCLDPQSFTHLPLSLESLTLHDVQSPIGWPLFSELNNLFTLNLYRCSCRDIQIEALGQLENLHIQNLKLEDCEFVGLSNLSYLKNLRKLEIVNCPHLVDIQGLGEVESLQSLSMVCCRYIKLLPDLSNLKKLKELKFVYCESLESIPKVDEEIPCFLQVVSCRHIVDFQGPYTKLKCTLFDALYKRPAAMSWTHMIEDRNVQKLLHFLKPLETFVNQS